MARLATLMLNGLRHFNQNGDGVVTHPYPTYPKMLELSPKVW